MRKSKQVHTTVTKFDKDWWISWNQTPDFKRDSRALDATEGSPIRICDLSAFLWSILQENHFSSYPKLFFSAADTFDSVSRSAQDFEMFRHSKVAQKKLNG